jgi:sec-independent protein translocase protein TatA
MAGISIWQLVIILGIVILLFGTKKLRNIGSDIGGAVKGFKSAVNDGEQEAKAVEKKDEEAVTQAKKEDKVQS